MEANQKVKSFRRFSFRRFFPYMVLIGGVAVLATAAPAFAASSGIAAVDGASASIVKLLQVIAGIAFLVLVGLSIWEFLAHRAMMKAGIELAGAIIVGLIAFNMQSVATTFGITGAFL